MSDEALVRKAQSGPGRLHFYEERSAGLAQPKHRPKWAERKGEAPLDWLTLCGYIGLQESPWDQRENPV